MFINIFFFYMKSVVWRYLQKMKLARNILLFLVLLQPYSFSLFYHRKYRNRDYTGLMYIIYIKYFQPLNCSIHQYYLLLIQNHLGGGLLLVRQGIFRQPTHNLDHGGDCKYFSYFETT